VGEIRPGIVFAAGIVCKSDEIILGAAIPISELMLNRSPQYVHMLPIMPTNISLN
jgi:hypothetical protein